MCGSTGVICVCVCVVRSRKLGFQTLLGVATEGRQRAVPEGVARHEVAAIATGSVDLLMEGPVSG